MKKKTKLLGAALIAALLIVGFAVMLTACKDPDDGSGAIPVITINTQPAATTTVTQGSISGSLSVSASVTQNATLSYQWYSNTSASNVGGSVITGVANASFAIPTNLTTGTYYYFVEVSATGGAASVRSNAATVNVLPPQGNTDCDCTDCDCNDGEPCDGDCDCPDCTCGGDPDNRVKLTAYIPNVDVDYDATTAFGVFAGASGLALTEADFTVTGGASITNIYYSGDNLGVQVALTVNPLNTPRIFTIGINPDSEVIKGDATVTITQAANPIPDTRVELTAGLPVNAAYNDTSALVTFSGATYLELTTADFTVDNGASIDYVWFAEYRFNVAVNFTANSGNTQRIFTVGINPDSEVIKGDTTVTITQAAVPLPEITINTQPALTTSVMEGYISGSLSVSASVTLGAELSYQWYSNSTPSTNGGSAIEGAANASFPIPTTLTAVGSPYFYFVEVSATGGATPVRSNAATVTVSIPTKAIIAVEPDYGTMSAGGWEWVDFIVTTTLFENGYYIVNVANLPEGVTIPAGYESINITDNLGRLLLSGSYTTVAGVYDNLILTLDGVISPPFTLFIKQAGGTVDSPTLASKTQTSITVNAPSAPSTGQAIEYIINTANSPWGLEWQDDRTFSGLNAATNYYIFARAKENAIYGAGAASAALQVTTDAPPVPEITITTQPAATTPVEEGSISGSLSVSASVTLGATLSYQWYSNTTASTVGGSPINGATNASFPIPTTLTAANSPYFYFVEVRATGGATSVRSNPATVTVSPPAAVTSFIVTNNDEWLAALAAIREDGDTIKDWTIIISGNPQVNGITAAISATTGFGTNTGITVTLKGNGAGSVLQKNTSNNGSIIRIASGQKLIIDDASLTLRGRADYNNNAIVYVQTGAELELKAGTITGNYNNAIAITSGGGGVHLQGSFTMTGGSINDSITGESGYYNGGVLVNGGGTFTMKGGEIRNNNAAFNGAGVLITNGSFIMEGGTISGNTAELNGGGVYVNSGCTFTKTGGTISGNIAAAGKGVYVNANNSGTGTFILSGNNNIVDNIGLNAQSDSAASAVTIGTGGWNGTTTLDLRGNNEAYATVASWWAGKQVITGSGYTLTDTDIAKFTLGNFINDSGETQAITNPPYYLGTGADRGKLMHHIAVTNITGVPTQATVGTQLTLTGTVAPSDATNKTIAWSVQNAGTTGATITNGNRLNTTAAGTVTVRATITNGLTPTTNYTKDFEITAIVPPPQTIDITSTTTYPNAASIEAAIHNTLGYYSTVYVIGTRSYSPSFTLTIPASKILDWSATATANDNDVPLITKSGQGQLHISGGTLTGYRALGIAIKVTQGNLRISGNDTIIESQNTSITEGTIIMEAGNLIMEGGLVHNDGTYGQNAIINTGLGAINISGGTVGVESRTTYIDTTGNINISGTDTSILSYINLRSSGNSTITGGTVNQVENYGTGTLTISDGTVEGYVYNKNGTTTINGGTIGYVDSSVGTNINITGGTIVSAPHINKRTQLRGTTTINGGTIGSIYSSGTTTITGGNINSGSSVAITITGGVTTINSGTISSANNVAAEGTIVIESGAGTGNKLIIGSTATITNTLATVSNPSGAFAAIHNFSAGAVQINAPNRINGAIRLTGQSGVTPHVIVNYSQAATFSSRLELRTTTHSNAPGAYDYWKQWLEAAVRVGANGPANLSGGVLPTVQVMSNAATPTFQSATLFTTGTNMGKVQ